MAAAFCGLGRRGLDGVVACAAVMAQTGNSSHDVVNLRFVADQRRQQANRALTGHGYQQSLFGQCAADQILTAAVQLYSSHQTQASDGLYSRVSAQSQPQPGQQAIAQQACPLRHPVSGHDVEHSAGDSAGQRITTEG